MNQQTIRFRLGLFVLCSLILLAVLIVLFGGRPTFFRTTDQYTITFDNAPGVVQGTPVRKSGVKIGEVERVELDDETGKVRVFIRVEDRYRLRKSDEAVLRQSLLGSDTKIDFLARKPEPGQAVDTTTWEPGSTIVGVELLDTGQVVEQAGKTLQPAEEAMKEMSKVMKKFDKMFPLMEDTLKEFRDVAKVTKEILPDLKNASKDIAELARVSKELVPELKVTNKEIQDLVKSTNKMVPEFNRTMEELQQTARNWGKVGERVDLLLQTNEKKMVKALDDLSKTLEEMSKVFSKENRDSLNEILKNASTASKDLESIAKNTDLLLKDSRKTLNKVNDAVEKTDRVMDNLEKVTKPMSERSEKILKNLDEATAQLNLAMGEFRVLMQGVSKSEGTVYKLLNDPLLYNRLNESAGLISKVMPRLDQILRDVEIFADKIARHPELLGVGGAIRPSSGLKDFQPYPMIWKQAP